ncbi:hypothetical protein LWC08_02985 [Desulfobaculum bizertense]|uniref:hypothetical protein n=1 Tax=Desulfobaculum bizertense TaxID=376490 RepID=UPI001F432051|nr:hypothetical protein [Desulfobaculum bizertense]UIJ38549.1 hypothetical protein LWC08_02985 [Desulfobaculum bizertense]
MKPGKGTTRLRPELGAVVTEDMMLHAADSGYIAPIIAPYFSVTSQSGTFPVIPAKALYNIDDVTRSSGAGYNRAVEPFEAGFYATKERGLEAPVDTRFSQIYKDQFDAEMVATDICKNKVQRAYEEATAKKLTSKGNFESLPAAVPWTESESADPRAMVNAGIRAMRKKGAVPNALEVSWQLFQYLRECKAVKEAVFSLFPDTQKTGNITQAQLETYLDIKLLIGGAVKNTRQKSADLTDIWPDDRALLCTVAPQGADISMPSVARTMLWNEGGTEEIIVEDYYSDEIRSNVIRVRHDYDLALIKSLDEDRRVLSDISRACGLLLTDLVK